LNSLNREGKHYYAYSEDFTGVYGLDKTLEEAKESCAALHCIAAA
jgi:hypothetical protein